MDDLNAKARFFRRDSRVAAIEPKALVPEGKPGHGRHNACFNFTTSDQVTEPGFDEHAMARALGVGKQRAEGENFHYGVFTFC